MSKIELSKYSTIIFDCDGVILNSNDIKTNAFYEIAKVYGHLPALELKNYHKINGGVSRYEKFNYLFTNILCRPFESEEIGKLLLKNSEKNNQR